jgi:hypothetical protein
MHRAFDATGTKLGLGPAVDKATEYGRSWSWRRLECAVTLTRRPSNIWRTLPMQDRHLYACRTLKSPLPSSSTAMSDSSSATVRNVSFVSTSNEFRAALLQRSASSRIRVGRFVAAIDFNSHLARGKLVIWVGRRQLGSIKQNPCCGASSEQMNNFWQ